MDGENGWYNGYDWKTREKKLRELNRKRARRELDDPKGPCLLCGDPEAAVEYHDEDYSEPYLWEPPAMLVLCRNCHRDKLHKRFSRPAAWKAFLEHVRRGGYASDIKNYSCVKREVAACQAAIELGQPFTPLLQIRPYTAVVGEEWFAELRLDIESLRDPRARPRP